ncbi:MAG: hypothetical protein SGI73_22450 [Chloroflexota bacterium]|nr:hypothetical protein [Chloroflexota bacterium]
MDERQQDLWDNLTAARAHLNTVLDCVGDAWNVRQLLTHLMVSDAGQNQTIMGIAAGREVIPADFDIELPGAAHVGLDRGQMDIAGGRGVDGADDSL